MRVDAFSQTYMVYAINFYQPIIQIITVSRALMPKEFLLASQAEGGGANVTPDLGSSARHLAGKTRVWRGRICAPDPT